MTCNAKAFEVGDRCVVEFGGQDWASPRVIGFVDNPKPCTKVWVRFYRDGESFSQTTLLYEKEVFIGETVIGPTTPAQIDSVVFDPINGGFVLNGPRNFMYWTDRTESNLITSYSLKHPDIITALPKILYVYWAEYEPVIYL